MIEVQITTEINGKSLLLFVEKKLLRAIECYFEKF